MELSADEVIFVEVLHVVEGRRAGECLAHPEVPFLIVFAGLVEFVDERVVEELVADARLQVEQERA